MSCKLRGIQPVNVLILQFMVADNIQRWEEVYDPVQC